MGSIPVGDSLCREALGGPNTSTTIPRPSIRLDRRLDEITDHAGSPRSLSFGLDKSSLASYDATKKDWVAGLGAFEVLVGLSLRDIDASFEAGTNFFDTREKPGTDIALLETDH